MARFVLCIRIGLEWLSDLHQKGDCAAARVLKKDLTWRVISMLRFASIFNDQPSFFQIVFWGKQTRIRLEGAMELK